MAIPVLSTVTSFIQETVQSRVINAYNRRARLLQDIPIVDGRGTSHQWTIKGGYAVADVLPETAVPVAGDLGLQD